MCGLQMGDASAWATGVRNKGKETGYRTRGVDERKVGTYRGTWRTRVEAQLAGGCGTTQGS